MRDKPIDATLPEAKPFFGGYWADTAGSNGAWVQLVITADRVIKQHGMKLDSGGCRVPIAGIYQIGSFCRSDSSGSGATYAHTAININGTSTTYSIRNNGYVGGVEWPYTDHQLWIAQPLLANDLIQIYGFQASMAGTFFGGGWTGDGLRVMYDSPWTGEP